MKDLVIIGSGAAGLSAAVYAKRARLDVVVVEKEPFSGGQIVSTERVDNYLGCYGKSGYELAMSFREHADTLGVDFLSGCVAGVEAIPDGKVVLLENGTRIETKSVLIATGANHRELDVPGEAALKGGGVSYCATCDGAFYKGMTVAVVGGGDVALEDALYLSKICSKVYLIHRREELRGARILQKNVFETKNIEFLPNTVVKEIVGTSDVEAILVAQKEKEPETLKVDGVFIAVGMKPNSEFLKGIVDVDSAGYIVAGEDCKTSDSRIFVAGDVRTKSLRQVVTAVSDGAVAVNTILENLY